MQRLHHKEGRRLSKTTITRVISTFNTDLSLHPRSREGRPKSAIVDKNVAKIKRSPKKALDGQSGICHDGLDYPLHQCGG